MVVCCTEDGQIVGVYSGIPYRAWWKNKVIRLTQLMDIMVHPDYRRDGLFLHMAETFFDWYGPPAGSVCLYGFPGALHFRIGSRLLHYKAVSPQTAYLTAEPSTLMKNIRPFQGRLEQVSTADFSFDQLAARWRHQQLFAIIRDADFINWRFIQHPHYNYQIWAYRPFIGRKWHGYGIFSVHDKSIRLVDIVMPSEPKLASDFLARIAAEFHGGPADKLETWLPPGQRITHCLGNSGLVAGKEPFGIIPTVKILHSDLRVNWLAHHLYYTMADADLC